MDLTRKAAVASVGLIGARAISTWGGNQIGRFFPTVGNSRWAPTAIAALTTGVLWWAGGQNWTPSIWRRNRELVALGAGLHFVEEVLGILLPMVGLGPGRGGVLGEAIYGSSMGGLGGVGGTCAHGQALGGCQYGCAWPNGGVCPTPFSPAGFPAVTAAPVVMSNGQVVASNGQVVSQVAGDLAGCQYGCAWPAPGPCPVPQPGVFPTQFPTQVVVGPNGVPVATTVAGMGVAGDMALRKAGDAARDPYVANLLVQRAGQVQATLDSVGIGR